MNNNKLKLDKFDLSAIERLAMEAPESVETAQADYDEALDKYVEKRAVIEFNALTNKEHFQDKDAHARSASCDMERRSLQKMLVAQDKDLSLLRKDMQAKRRVLKLWQTREKNVRAILSARAEAE